MRILVTDGTGNVGRACVRGLVGTETLVSIDRARALLGFETQYSLSAWLS